LSRNRQEITEELYLDLWDGDFTSYEGQSFKDISTKVRCEPRTTRGYFELGNTLNKNTHDSLLDRWPGPEQIQNEFNDYVKTDLSLNKGFVPTEK